MSNEDNWVESNMIRSSLIIPVNFGSDSTMRVPSQKKTVIDKLVQSNWGIYSINNEEDSDICVRQRNLLQKHSSFHFKGMSKTFQRVWMPSKIDEFSVHLLKYKVSSNQRTCVWRKKRGNAQIHRVLIKEIMLLITPFADSYLVLQIENAEPVNVSEFLDTLSNAEKRVWVGPKSNLFHKTKVIHSDIVYEKNSEEWEDLYEKIQKEILSDIVEQGDKNPLNLFAGIEFIHHHTSIRMSENPDEPFWANQWVQTKKIKPNYYSNYKRLKNSGALLFENAVFPKIHLMDGATLYMAREGVLNVVVEDENTNTDSINSLIDRFHHRYLLIHLLISIQYDRLQELNNQVIKVNQSDNPDDVLDKIKAINRHREHFEHWIPDDIGGSTTTIQFYMGMCTLYQLQTLRKEVQNSVNALEKRYEEVAKIREDSVVSGPLQYVAILLSVIGVLSIPTIQDVQGQLPYIGFAVLFSLMVHFGANKWVAKQKSEKSEKLIEDSKR